MSGPHRKSREHVSRKLDGRVYVFHFAKPIGSDKHQAQHYTGHTPRSVEERYADHKAGRGARLTQVANEKGIDYWPVCNWPGNRDIENQLKLQSAKVYCPECTPNPRVPRIVQQAIKREERSRKYQAAKERAQARMREIMSKPATSGEKQRYGAEAASNYVSGMLAKGISSQRIQEAAENLAAGDRGNGYSLGWNLQIESDLATAREMERRDETEMARQEEMTEAEELKADRAYRDNLTALADKEAPEHPSWLPSAEELSRHPAYGRSEMALEREAG